MVIVPVPYHQFQFISLGYDYFGVWCQGNVAFQLLAILEAHRMEVHKEIDDGCQKVLCRVGKERFRTAFLFTASLVQGSQQGSSGFRSCRQVRNVLALNRIDAVRILHVRKVDNAKATVLWQFTSLAVLAILIEKCLGQCRELKIIAHDSKSLGCMLTDKGIDDTK